MNLLVDTSVWSLALRRDRPADVPQVRRLRAALEHGEALFTTGLILQELLQGFDGPKARAAILAHFQLLPMLVPDREDHVAAAELRNIVRRRGIQLATIDALLAQLAIRHDLGFLTTDADFGRAAPLISLRLIEGE
jgi:predicted nucleic acid-binding protein